jgi:hypothetical protein
MTFLTKENAPNVVLVRNIDDPERGTLRFNYNAHRLASGRRCSTVGPDGNDHLLPWQEYGHWEVVSFRPASPIAAAREEQEESF